MHRFSVQVYRHTSMEVRDSHMVPDASIVDDRQRLRRIEGPAAWRGEDLAKTSDWIYRLSSLEKTELERIVATLRRGGKPREQITRDDVPLGAFAPAVHAWRSTLG